MRALSFLVLSLIASSSLLTACRADLAPMTSAFPKRMTYSDDSTSEPTPMQLGKHEPSEDYASADEPVTPVRAPAAPSARDDADPVVDASAASASAKGKACDFSVIDALKTPVTEDPSPVRLTCQVKLPKKTTVTRQVLFEGAASSGAAIDCSGSLLKGTDKGGDREPLVVRSKLTGGGWSRPVGVMVKNCVIDGGVRIYGLGRTGEGEYVKQSSMNANHTAFAQASAPKGTVLSKVKIRVKGRTALYAGPGVTGTTLVNSVIEGSTTSVAMYLDAESGGAKIKGNTFNIATTKRELIALDGSARNEIENNTFNDAANGGIFAYRNCGEGGTIRHQAPQFNRIEGNTFNMEGSNKPAVWLNSRNGDRPYCFQDPRHPFGSSLTPMDLAKKNVVEDNHIIGARGDAIRNNDPSNTVENNGG